MPSFFEMAPAERNDYVRTAPHLYKVPIKYQASALSRPVFPFLYPFPPLRLTETFLNLSAASHPG